MRKAWMLVVTAGLLGAGLVSAPAGAAPVRDVARAAACAVSSSTTVTGGYQVRLSCAGVTGYLVGFGTTLTDAQLEATLLAQVYSATGQVCSGSSTTSEHGGYLARLSCRGVTGYLNGYGTTLTAAARNARLLVTVLAEKRVSCSGSSVTTATGGYLVRVSCRGVTGYLVGYGTTITDAGAEAGLLAELYADSGRACSGSSVTRESGAYLVRLSCRGVTGYLSGYGATLTDAAANARLLASIP